MTKAKIADANISLNTIMPNGKLLGDCTFSEGENFKIGDLTDLADIGFWIGLLQGVE
jgi:hypothetical protein